MWSATINKYNQLTLNLNQYYGSTFTLFLFKWSHEPTYVPHTGPPPTQGGSVAMASFLLCWAALSTNPNYLAHQRMRKPV
jgi:hypothetical protein